MKKYVLFILVLLLCFSFISCDDVLGSPLDFLFEKLGEEVEKLDFAYTVKIRFENENDKSIFIERLAAKNCTVTDTKEIDGVTEYTLAAEDFIGYSQFDLLCENHEITICDFNGNEILQRENALSVSGQLILSVKLDDETMQRFKDNYVGYDICFKKNDEVYDLYVLEEDGLIVLYPTNERYHEDISFSLSVFLSSADYSGEVQLENVQRIK